MNNEDTISRTAAKAKKVYSEERHEYVVPVAELDWLPSVQPKDAIYSLGGMVLQFGCALERKGKKYIYDGGLSALERAFSVLADYGCPLERDGTIGLDEMLKFMDKMDGGGEDDAAR